MGVGGGGGAEPCAILHTNNLLDLLVTRMLYDDSAEVPVESSFNNLSQSEISQSQPQPYSGRIPISSGSRNSGHESKDDDLRLSQKFANSSRTSKTSNSWRCVHQPGAHPQRYWSISYHDAQERQSLRPFNTRMWRTTWFEPLIVVLSNLSMDTINQAVS